MLALESRKRKRAVSGPEEALLRKFQSGDDDALQALLTRHEAMLRGRIGRWLPAHVRRRLSVSDVWQETCVVVAERREDFEFRGENSFRNWMLGIAQKKVRRAVQRHVAVAKRAAYREVTRGHRGATTQFVSGAPSPSQVAIGAELAALAKDAIESLPDDYQTILRLCRNEGLSLREAGERMGRSREAAKKLYGRALARFARVFGRLKGETRA